MVRAEKYYAENPGYGYDVSLQQGHNYINIEPTWTLLRLEIIYNGVPLFPWVPGDDTYIHIDQVRMYY